MPGTSPASGRARVVAAATAAALVLVSVLAGCSATEVPAANGPLTEPAEYATVLGDEESNFEGRLLQVVIEGLVTGAAEQAGGDAYGNILAVLGWGGSGSDDYSRMQKTLNDIDSGIAEIRTELAAMQSQLKITEDEIIGNNNDPTAAITEITTFDDELQGLSAAGSPGKGDPRTVLAFAGKIEDRYGIENDVHSIHDAMIPQTQVKSGVLDNFTEELILRMNASSGVGLKDAYLALEMYFSQLLYYQMQGVTLVVEAKTAVVAGGGTEVGSSAAQYYRDFTTNKLAPQVQRFMDNTWRLIAARVSLAHTSGFLPAEADHIAARAEFLRTQTLAMDHFGLRAHAVVTSNHSGELVSATAKAADGTAFTANGTITSTVHAAALYDSWKGNQVSPSDEYQVVTFDFGARPAGTYTISGPAGFAPAAVQVQAYTADYQTDPAGKILYGCALGHTRVGAVEAFAAGAGGAAQTEEPGAASPPGASPATGKISISGHKVNGSYSDETQVEYRFVFGGSKATKVTIPSQAHAYGKVSTSIEIDMDGGGSAHADIAATMGVLDATTGKMVGALSSWSAESDSNQKASLDKRPPKAFVFTAQPGHRYAVYFAVSASGSARDGAATSELTIDSMNGMQIQF
ncbi:MAG: hypothetical protein IT193_06700 [Propionibacteriaceae bacterium]|nr:hypothetical protein [Propionibacteriaceae bacterium]